MKRIVAIGVAFGLMVSAGMTVSARHHASCMGRVLQSTFQCQQRDCPNSRYHLFCHGDGQNCGLWGVDVHGLCDGWAYCENGYGAGATSSASSDQTEDNLTQPQVEEEIPVTESTYGGDAYYPDYGQNQTAGYGNGGHHEEWHHSSSSYGTGYHRSGHHGHH